MTAVRPENLEMKIPALLHLSRLGYVFLSGAQLRSRDRGTNLLPARLHAALERINGTRVSPETFDALLEDLRSRLDAPDLGQQFYRLLRDGWQGLRLIDFDRPERNTFHSASELTCGKGAGSFRPDIALFVNGLPLAMIELKRQSRSRSLRAEYDRMLARFRLREARPYLQCTQVWAFSDDRTADPDRFEPMEGTWFAAVMANEFPVCAVRETRFRSSHPLVRNPEEEDRILCAHGLREEARSQNLHSRKETPRAGLRRSSLRSSRPTHRMLTALFAPDNFLFLLHYGIQYLRETDASGQVSLTRRMLTLEQLGLLKALIRKAERGYRSWTVPACGAAGEEALNASMLSLLRDLFPASRLCWVSESPETLKRDQRMFSACGLHAVLPQSDPAGTLMIVSADSAPKYLLQNTNIAASSPPIQFRTPQISEPGPPRVVILPSPSSAFEPGPGLFARLRRANPAAVLITRSPRPASESPAGTCGGMLGFSLRLPSENACKNEAIQPD